MSAKARFILAFIVIASVCGCTTTTENVADRAPKNGPRDFTHVPDAVPQVEPLSRGGNASSYEVWGKRYHTLPSAEGYVERGVASWYGEKFHGRKTANGEIYDMYEMSAAHRSLPLPTYVSVRVLASGRSVVVRINDRGPFHGNRLIDLSFAAASKLGIAHAGTAEVEVRAINPNDSASERVAGVTDLSSAPVAQPEEAEAVFGERVFLQAGAFKDIENARTLHEQLRAIVREDVAIDTQSAVGSDLFKVKLGPFSNVADADVQRRELLALGFDSPTVLVDE